MSFDVFALRQRVVSEYQSYVRSFVHILDGRIRAHVENALDQGDLWPDAVLQLNPAYVPGPTLAELADQGLILAETARFFGPGLRLHRHQEEALRVAARGESYVVSTGTGSGKSLTYLIPIVDRIFRNGPERASVRAIIVYPMNALINSQLDALARFRDGYGPGCPIRFGQHTGQIDREARNALLNDPPHILLTNYVMLEYMMIRPNERTLVDSATRELEMVAMDELHVYRGRQGADVAMLMRRLRQRAGRGGFLHAGTSATLVSGGSRAERLDRIAEVGSRLFGVPVRPDNVIDETLRRIAAVPVPTGRAALRAAVEMPPPAATAEAVSHHPLAAWAEQTFGIVEEEGRLVRRSPVAFDEGLRRLAEETGLGEALCRERLRAVLDIGNAARLPTGEPVFAFRLHQFLASGGSVYATLETPERRTLGTEGQAFAPGTGDRPMFPLAFCRECGQEYYMASLIQDGPLPGTRLVPRSPLLGTPDDENPGVPGYLAIEHDGMWSDDEDLPDVWLEHKRGGWQIKARYVDHRPVLLRTGPDGRLDPGESGGPEGDGEGGKLAAWWQPKPFMLCLRCRASYDLREKRDFRKLVTLSQTGRSTATTITGVAAILGLRASPDVPADARKLLSFTDNRQDASLQAGHLNDFIQVVQLRGALCTVLGQAGEIRHDTIGDAVFGALKLRPDHFMKDPVAAGPGYNRAADAMRELLAYRAFEDLARAWRVAQPNLEQCGLLRIDYDGLAEFAADDRRWAGAPVIAAARPERREAVLRAILDHLRSELALDADALKEEHLRALVRRVSHTIADPWAFDELDRPRTATIALLPDRRPEGADAFGPVLSLGPRSTVGRYLRSRRTWDLDENLTQEEGQELVHAIVKALRKQFLTVEERGGAPYGVRLKVDALIWRPGIGQPLPPDPVRSRSLHLRRRDLAAPAPNAYFTKLYRELAGAMAGLHGHEHTGQVPQNLRVEREERFKDGSLPILFCSPTMELGVDIRDLGVVHMRNVPPTPANYAQRSGRAGRGGRPALVLAFAQYGNDHDQYYFRRRGEMIAGAVAAPRLDLTNRDLVQAHLHSIWMAANHLKLDGSIADVLDLDNPALPIKADIAADVERCAGTIGRTLQAFRDVVGTLDAPETPSWLNGDWLRSVAQGAPKMFDDAFDRWRELYRAAVAQRDAARRLGDRTRIKEERQRADQREREAKREIALLCNQGSGVDSEFYTYRYLANEGFIPGYNFPRLPLRALASVSGESHVIVRPRFLGLAEFGPGNLIYHEGRKHRIAQCLLPPGGIEGALTRAKLCGVCGYVHTGPECGDDACRHCGSVFERDGYTYPQALLPQPTVRALRWHRISSEEEERVREGYRITTHFRLIDGAVPRTVRLSVPEGPVLLEAQAFTQAELWRINHGWRRSASEHGFSVETSTGRWRTRDDDGADGNEGATLSGIRPYVTDTRNLLLLRPLPGADVDDGFLLTLAYALRRALQVQFQVEEQELSVELIGGGRHRRILLWEAAEGGIGIAERLVDAPEALGSAARLALALCHADPDTGIARPDWDSRCSRACYHCLMSYSNQLDHRFLDRRLITPFLFELTRATVQTGPSGRSREDQYAWLCERTDTASPAERRLLDHLHANGHILPDFAQHCPAEEVPAQADFFYRAPSGPGACVFVDGDAHRRPERSAEDRRIRRMLEERGFRVIAIDAGCPLDEQLARWPDVFGA
ncbi:DEAD/DEAH box helicase [Roseomonas genomospecies 6]|uniref:DUF1998 domain-containing protein n=1 Tax=Roseomonas genomospecies 6 TaxID=214106 RepID=A0A9W7NGN9_9PROT|nr:DEAD/DEAH box helicase [Roseomonas genomospecies 6]KAA0677177.1 DUF1998 domain-containing protein [Roseomonas genomospecies 6]